MSPILSIGLAPREVLFAIAGVVITGVVVIGLASLLKNWRAQQMIKKLGELGVWEGLRDLGIALVVAGIVSGIYEWSTRSIEENKKAVDLFNTINAYFVGEPVWNEYREEVLRAPFLRRNIEIRLRIFREWQSDKGEKVTMPPYRAVLWMEYAYDLYPLSKESWSIPLQHDLDYEMYDNTLNIPRFELVRLTRQVSQWKTQTRTLERDELKSYVENNRTFKIKSS